MVFADNIRAASGKIVHRARRWLCRCIIAVAYRVEPADERAKWPSVRCDGENRIIGEAANEPRV
jgi:hypothetical protein